MKWDVEVYDPQTKEYISPYEMRSRMRKSQRHEFLMFNLFMWSVALGLVLLSLWK